MFNKSVKSILAACALVAGATFAVPASAGNFNVYIGSGYSGVHAAPGHNQKYKHFYGNGFQKHHRKHRGYGHKYKNRVVHKGFCGPRRALRKAWHMGVNQPHIARLNKRKVVVVGYNRGHAAKVVFKRNSHRCKVIKARGLY